MSIARSALAVARVELTRLLRSPTSFTLLLLVPAFQVILFGTAIRPQGAEISVVVAAPSLEAGAWIGPALRAQTGLNLTNAQLAPGGAEQAVRRGEALVGIEVPPGPSVADPLAPKRPARVIINATNPALTEAAAAAITAAYWHEVAARGGLEASAPPLQIERLYNPQARADWGFLPALIGVTMMISMVMLGCLSLAREREAGTWETMLTLPIGRSTLLIGKALPYLGLGAAQGLLVLGVGVGLFGLPARGAVGALVALLPVFAAAHFLLGYAISARAKTQIDALQGAVGFYLPAMLLSGFLYPFETLPSWAQAIGNVFPLTHFIRIARDVLLRGRGWTEIGADSLAIVAFLGVAAMLSILLQSRKLD